MKLPGIFIQVLKAGTLTTAGAGETDDNGYYLISNLTDPVYFFNCLIYATEVECGGGTAKPGGPPVDISVFGYPETITVAGPEDALVMVTTLKWTCLNPPTLPSPYVVAESVVGNGSATLAFQNSGGKPEYWLTCFVQGHTTTPTSVELPGLKANESATVSCPP